MKTRLDFVSNSSSSSYIVAVIAGCTDRDAAQDIAEKVFGDEFEEVMKDEYGNPLYETIDDKTGATVLVPETSHVDEEGHVVYHNPKYGWQADAVEGLVNSTLLLIRDVFTEQGRQELRKNKARQRNAEIFLLRCFIFGFLAALLKAIYSGFKEEDMQEVKMAYNVATKASQDLSFYHSILEPVDEAGFVGVDML